MERQQGNQAATPNLILVGFMGTGKSAIGRRVAEQLALPFVDTDDEIVQLAGMPIPEIFAASGEAGFRALEHRVAIDVAQRGGCVIATGGGIVLDPANLDAFRESGLLIALTAEPETILKRVGSDTNRPLLQHPDRLERITELLEQRRDIYAAIAPSIATDDLSLATKVRMVADLYRAHLTSRES